MNAAIPWLVVFDLDGTLIDSSLDLCLAVNSALAHVYARQLPHAMIAGFIGDGAAMLIHRALAQSGGEIDHHERFESALSHFLHFYRVHKLDHTRLYDGVLTALQTIRQRAPELPLAVLTNKPVRPSREICQGLGIAPFFFANYGGDSFTTKKPDPAGLLHIMREAKQLRHSSSTWAEPELSGVVMIGDSEIDVFTAKRAGIRSIGCRYGLAPHALALAQPDAFCDRPEEWAGLLGL